MGIIIGIYNIQVVYKALPASSASIQLVISLPSTLKIVKETMAALSGKLVSQTQIKCDGNVFYQLFREETHRISSLSPEKIHGIELVEGVWGAEGSIICTKYVSGEQLILCFIFKQFTFSFCRY